MNNTYLLGDQAETFKNQMLAYPQIVNASVSDYLPVPSNNNNSAVLPEGDRDSKKATSMQNWIVDHDYITTLGMKIVDGRDFSKEFSTDTKATIINQAAAKQFDWANPVGRRIGRIVSNKGDMELYEVIGVVEDFHFQTLKETIGPLVMFLGNSNGNISFRVETEDISGTIGLLRKEWKKFLPYQPFEYNFLDERFAAMYQTEQRIGRIFGVFAGFAVFIGCLGLFALAAFTAEQRTKEIGIRKVLGATAPNIIRLLTREFVILIAVANVIAWPVAFLVMSGWLKDFSYRVPLTVWVFAGSGLLTLLIALLTVSFQAVKAALSDPATSLRYE
jgi:putative ABC transport system permease protein